MKLINALSSTGTLLRLLHQDRLLRALTGCAHRYSAHSLLTLLLISAEQAYADSAKLNEAITLLEKAAKGDTAADKIIADLEAFEPQVPSMPTTAAVLASIPAHGSHPGAQYRLAGDR